MTKEELFEKYGINESHNKWDNQIDSWYSIEIYRSMHRGNLPPQDDDSTIWVVQFLDKARSDMGWLRSLAVNGLNWGSFYLAAKRMVATHHEQILKEINSK